MSLRNNLTKSLSNISSNISSKMTSVKMPSLNKSVKMPSLNKSINMKNISQTVSNTSIVKIIMKNAGTTLLFILIISSLIILYQIFNTNLSKKNDEYYDEKIYILKKHLREGHENHPGGGKIPRHTGRVGAYCPGGCFKWTTSDPEGSSAEQGGNGDNVSVCHKDGCCTNKARELWPDDGTGNAPFDWKTNKNWQDANKDWYCHCWLGVEKGKNCCKSVISGVVVPPDDIFSNCKSGTDWGDGWSGFSGWGTWSSSSTNRKSNMDRWMCETFLAGCWKDNECGTCAATYGSSYGNKCTKDSDCKSNYCHPKKGTCACPVSGMKGDDCSICDRDHPTNRQELTQKNKNGSNVKNSDGSIKMKVINRCDIEIDVKSEDYLNHAPKGDSKLTSDRKEADTRGKGILHYDNNDYAGDNTYKFQKNGDTYWEQSYTTGNINNIPIENKGIGIDTRGVGVVRPNADNEMLDGETWTHDKEGFKGHSYEECFDKTILSSADQKRCKEWWKKTRKCSSFPLEYCSSKTPLGEDRCLQYPCCLWEYNMPSEAGQPKWVDNNDPSGTYNRDWMGNGKNNNDKLNYITDFIDQIGGPMTNVRTNTGRCIKGTTKDGIGINYGMKKIVDKYNENTRAAKNNMKDIKIEQNKLLAENAPDKKTNEEINNEYKHVDEYYYSEFKNRPLGGNSKTSYYRYLEIDPPDNGLYTKKIDHSENNFDGKKPSGGSFSGDSKKFQVEIQNKPE